jgi:hypothetical protein
MAIYYYAEVDPDTGKCYTISMLSEPVEKPTMIPLPPDHSVQLGDIYDFEAGAWHKPEPTAIESAQ